MRAGLQGRPRQAAWSAGLPEDLLWDPEGSDSRPQHKQEQHVGGF